MKLNKVVGSLVILLVLVLVPRVVLADKIDDMKSSKEVHIKSVEPTDIRFMYLVGDIFNEEYPGYTIDADSCNEDYTVCDIQKEGNTVVEKAKIIYEYDPTVKKVADSLIKNLSTDKDNIFFLNTIEYIEYYSANYKMNAKWYEENPDSDGGPEPLNMGDYSSELRKLFQYKNFSIRVGMGEDADFYFTQAGDTLFIYDDTLYGVSDMVTVAARNVIYVPEDTTDIEKAIKDYLSKYYDVKEVSREDNSKVSDILESIEQVLKDYYDDNAWLSNTFAIKEAYVTAMMNEMYYGEDAPGYFMTLAEPYLYNIELEDERMFSFAVVKDDKKASEDSKVKTSDVKTGVEISTDSIIPLDALIKVARVTSGDEYDKIVKLLKVTDVEMFDLKLFSKTTEDYITKLDDGTFKVKLPISESFKGKDLVVYYVDENNKVIEYKVEVEDGYAIFNTNHFSIYTLASKESNPNTYDNIMVYISLLLLSLTGVFFVSKKIKSNI